MSAPFNALQSVYNWFTGGLVYFYEDNYTSRLKRYLRNLFFLLSLLAFAFLVAAAGVTYSNSDNARAIRRPTVRAVNPSYCLPPFVICSDMTDPYSRVAWTPQLNCSYGTSIASKQCIGRLIGDANTNCWIINEQRYIRFSSPSDSLRVSVQYQRNGNSTFPPIFLAGLHSAGGGDATLIPTHMSEYPNLFGSRDYNIHYSRADSTGFNTDNTENDYAKGNDANGLSAKTTDLASSTEECNTGSDALCSLGIQLRMQSLEEPSEQLDVPLFRSSTLIGAIGGLSALSLENLTGFLLFFFTVGYWRRYSDRANYKTREAAIQMLKERVNSDALLPARDAFQNGNPGRYPMPPAGTPYAINPQAPPAAPVP